MTVPVLEYSSATTRSPRPLLSVLEKITLIAFGFVLPLICFGISACFRYPFSPRWQSGEWNRYILFIPDGRTGYPFYPLLLYCMLSLCVFVTRPALSRLLLVRMGLYSGLVLSVQYSWIQIWGTGLNSLLLTGVALGSNIILFGIVKGLERIPRKPFIYLCISSGAIAVLSAFLPVGSGNFRFGILPAEGFVVAGIFCLMFGPALCFGVYLRVSLLAMKVNRDTHQPGDVFKTVLAWIPWLGACAGAWRWSIHNAIEAYSRLPTSPPGCYIASAAAAGHPKFVGSTPVSAVDGSVYLTNQQLRRFKCVEIGLASVCPRVHHIIRRIYDDLGPPMAAYIGSHPLRADAAYLLLKPIEWVSFGSLMALVPEVRASVHKLYRCTTDQR
jgi:hypothetical protein